MLYSYKRHSICRFATAAAALGSSIYVVGGFDGKAYLSTAERYDPREGKWQKVITHHFCRI